MSIYFVSNSGFDANPGTSVAAPFKTIQRAASVAKSGDAIVLAGGVYREQVALPADGVTIKPVGGETPTIVGTEQLTQWTAIGSNQFTTTIQHDLGLGANQIFVNGVMWPEARWPKIGADISRPVKSSITKIVSVTGQQVVFTDSAIHQPDGFWVGATLQGWFGEGWIGTYGKVTAQVGQQITASWQWPDPQWAQSPQYEFPRAGNSYYLYGIKGCLTQAGEWFISGNTLTICLPPGKTPANYQIEMKQRQFALDLSGRKGVAVEGIRLFAATINSDKNTTFCTIDGIAARYVSHFQFYSGWEAPPTSGIVLNGNANTLTGSLIEFSAGDGATVTGSNHIIENNEIHDVNYAACDAAGIRAPWGSGFKFNWNLLSNSGRDAIKFSTCIGTEISYNRIHSAMLQTTDGGGIYADGTDGKGSRIHHNFIDDVHGGGFGGAGVYLDNNSLNYTVDFNVTYNVDIGAKHNHNNNNVIWDSNTFIATQFAMGSDITTGFSGTKYTNNIWQAPAISIGADAAVNSNNVGPKASAFVQISPAVGAYSDGLFDTGPTVEMPTYRDSDVTIAATSFDTKSGAVATAVNGNLSALAYCDLNNWVKYQAVDFYYANQGCILTIGTVAACIGKVIELHLDSPTGPLVGSYKIAVNTTDWWKFQSVTFPIVGAWGVRDLYMVFKANATCNVQSLLFV